MTRRIGTQRLTCNNCRTEWERQSRRGTPPALCPECRALVRFCSSCRQHRPVSLFGLSRSGHSGYCRPCHNSYRDRRLMEDTEKPELAAAFRAAMTPGGTCAICDREGGKKRLVVDHDHSCCPGPVQESCGLCVRGVICHRCNSAIGFLGDSLEMVERAVRYLSPE